MAFVVMAVVAVWPRVPVNARLRIPDQPLDLGKGAPGSVLRGSFLLGNQGVRELRYTLKASCGCSALRPAAGTIPAKRAQEI